MYFSNNERSPLVYRHLQSILSSFPRLRALPLVDKDDNMILLGSVTRRRLLLLLNEHVGDEARLVEGRRRHTEKLKASANTSSTTSVASLCCYIMCNLGRRPSVLSSIKSQAEPAQPQTSARKSSTDDNSTGGGERKMAR